MATYGGAVDLVLTELARSDTSITAVVERELLKAIEFYSTERFWFNEARISFTASSTIYYPFSTVAPNLLEVDMVSTTVNGGVIELCPESHQELQRIDSNNFTGHPTHYAIFAEQFRLYPEPASGTTYQIKVDGTKRLTTLSASTDTNAWTNQALDMIAARVESQLCAKKFKNHDAANAYKAVEIGEFDKLKQRTERLLSTGRIRSQW